MKFYICLIYVLLIYSCNRTPYQVTEALEASGQNRKELEKVISYYQQLGDGKKLKAAYFLIENMKDKFYFDGWEVHKFDSLFQIPPDSIRTNKLELSGKLPYFQIKFDTLKQLFGPPDKSQAERKSDIEVIKANYLIDNIEWAFKLRNTTKWGKKVNFTEFCEHILPYRTGNEPLEPWRQKLFINYQHIRDSAQAQRIIDLAIAINSHLKNNFYINNTFQSYPFDIPISQTENIHCGSCKSLANYTAMAMRANGIPAGIDIVLLWGNRNKGHEWNYLVLEDGKIFPFEVLKSPLTLKLAYKPAKVFRNSFVKIEKSHPEDPDYLPRQIINEYLIDVTDEYVKTYNIRIPYKYHSVEKKKYGVICTFDNKFWQVQTWGECTKDNYSFNKMGADIAYLPMCYDDDDEKYPVNDPFILEKNGKIRYLIPSTEKKQDMMLLRKYPCFTNIKEYMESMIGGSFQGANKEDFTDAVNLYSITNTPVNFNKVSIHNNSSFKYVRYLFPDKVNSNVAEIEFYAENKQGTNRSQKVDGKIIGNIRNTKMFDGDPATYFNSKSATNKWIGMMFDKPLRIIQIGFCPRSDTNYILVGDEYELCYWDHDSWKSLGKQIATENYLLFKNVLSGALYVLHDLSKGKEERIFTFENGKQVWW